jgi:hypothetical protein
LTASGLAYPSSDGTANQVMATDGAGVLGWADTLTVVAVPGSQGAGGALGQVAYSSSYFYWFDGASWQRVAADPTLW